MKIAVFASGAFAAPTLDWLAGGAHEVVLVVTQPARGSGRGRKLSPTPTAERARQLNLPVLEVENVNAPEVVGRLAALDARLGVVIAFGQKLGPGVLETFPGGCINLHASLLPRLRGAAPINWAIANGDRETGCTVFRLVERMDAGPILAQRATELRPDETAGELHDRLAELGIGVVADSIAMFDGGRLPEGTPQDESRATYARKLTKADGVIDLSRSTERVLRHIRAMTPWPGATTVFRAADGRWENVTLLKVTPSASPNMEGPPAAAGTLDAELRVRTADGAVEIVELKPSSGRAMSWRDYVNGRHVKPGDRFAP